MASAVLHRCNILTLSFSGAGHLLPYHLGVASALYKKMQVDRGTNVNESTSITAPIKAVSGSSSGAIAATIYAYFPHRIEEYADRFISDGGRAMFHLKGIMNEEELNSLSNGLPDENKLDSLTSPCLHIATTRCSDGLLRLFDFPSLPEGGKEQLFKCLEASCKIPRHFHPFDVLPNRWSPPSTYPEEDGVVIDGNSYVDGGISAPAPPTPLDSVEGAVRIVVSPISGSISDEANAIRISPADDSWRLFPMNITCRGNFSVRPSMQNIRALQTSAGVASTIVLREWFERGVNDGSAAVMKLS